jgi:hypothetical protein
MRSALALLLWRLKDAREAGEAEADRAFRDLDKAVSRLAVQLDSISAATDLVRLRLSALKTSIFSYSPDRNAIGRWGDPPGAAAAPRWRRRACTPAAAASNLARPLGDTRLPFTYDCVSTAHRDRCRTRHSLCRPTFSWLSARTGGIGLASGCGRRETLCTASGSAARPSWSASRRWGPGFAVAD